MTNILNSQSSPIFKATLATPVANVTGDGTVYTCLFDTLASGSGYNPATGNFTCSVPGDYLLIARVNVTGATSSHTICTGTFVASTGSYLVCDFNLATGKTSANAMIFTPAVMVLRMATGDTVHFDIKASNGTKVVTFGALSQFQGVRLP